MNQPPPPLQMWNQRFDQAAYIFGEEPNAYLQSQAQHLKPGSALAVADGEGRNGVWLAQQGLKVTGFDLSAVAIQKAQQLAARKGVRAQWVCSDWHSFDWAQAPYDNVVGIFVQFAPPAEREALFQRMDASLKPGGTLVIQGYSLQQLSFNTGGPGKREHLYDEALLTRAFAAYDLLDLRTYEAVLSEGTAHSGRSGLIGLTARKR